MNELNPYAPTTEASESPSEFDNGAAKPKSRGQVIRRWTWVCGLAAAPSFVLGFMVTRGQVLGMLTGVAIFILLYSWADLRTSPMTWRQNQVVRRTLVTTYSIRILMTVVFPVGGYLDTISGFFAAATIGALTGTTIEQDEFGFGLTLLMTLVQGSYLNVVLFIIGLLLLPIIAVITRWRQRSTT
ncbi:MAG: hypothetical protein AAGD07_06835 [Planctomycetota bacterium]